MNAHGFSEDVAWYREEGEFDEMQHPGPSREVHQRKINSIIAHCGGSGVLGDWARSGPSLITSSLQGTVLLVLTVSSNLIHVDRLPHQLK